MAAAEMRTRMAIATDRVRAAALRELRPGTRAQVRVIDIDTGVDRLLFDSDRMVEAPNWPTCDEALIVNGGGGLYRLPFDRPRLEPIHIVGIDDVNNDHLVSLDGRTLYVSAGGAVYSVAYAGGRPNRLTPDDGRLYFLHGVSPAGNLLAMTTIDLASGEEGWGVDLLPVGGGDPKRLIASSKPLDGPEWAPDGAWIWFNAELGADQPGHARLFRIRPDGSETQ